MEHMQYSNNKPCTITIKPIKPIKPIKQSINAQLRLNQKFIISDKTKTLKRFNVMLMTLCEYSATWRLKCSEVLWLEHYS